MKIMCRFVGLSVGKNVASGSCSGAGSSVGISSKFLMGNILLLMLLKTFSFAPINNLTLLRKN